MKYFKLKKILIFAIVFAFSTISLINTGVTVAKGERANLPTSTAVYNGKAYCAYNFDVMGVEKMTYDEVVEYCKNLGGKLAVISDKNVESAVNSAVRKASDNGAYYLLGGRVKTDGAYWDNGNKIDKNTLSNIWNVQTNDTLIAIKTNDANSYNEHRFNYYGLTEELNRQGSVLSASKTGFVCEIEGNFCSAGVGSEIYTEHVSPKERVVQKATCSLGGYSEVYCEHCDAILEVKQARATGHFFNDWVDDKGSVLILTHERSRTCAVCGHVESETNPAIWVLVLIGVLALLSVFGLINYVRILRRIK